MLPDNQRADLHRAIVGYVASQGHSVQQLAADLEVDSQTAPDPVLELKWGALVRLQRRILELEADTAKLKDEVVNANNSAGSTLVSAGESKSTTSSSLANWLPRWPPKHTLVGHRARVTNVSFHPQWTMLASCSDDGEIKVWDYEQGELERTVRAHTRAVHALAFAPVSNLLISCSADLSLKVFDPKNDMANVKTLLGHDHTVSAVIAYADLKTKREYIVSGSRDKTVRIWELETGFVVTVLRGHTDWVRTLAISTPTSDSETPYLLSAGSDRSARLTPLLVDRAPMVYEGGHQHVIECCSIASPASAQFLQRHLGPIDHADIPELYFATGARDSCICVWSSRHREPLLRLVGHDNWVQGVSFHPNGRFLFSVSDDKTMRIWDLATGKLAKTISAHDHFITSIAWHRKHIATSSVDRQVRIWS